MSVQIFTPSCLLDSSARFLVGLVLQQDKLLHATGYDTISWGHSCLLHSEIILTVDDGRPTGVESFASRFPDKFSTALDVYLFVSQWAQCTNSFFSVSTFFRCILPCQNVLDKCDRLVSYNLRPSCLAVKLPGVSLTHIDKQTADNASTSGKRYGTLESYLCSRTSCDFHFCLLNLLPINPIDFPLNGQPII